MDNRQILIVVVLVLVGGLIYLSSPETRSIAFSVPYQDPVYRTDSYQDPIYGTVYSGTIGTLGLTAQTWTISDATSNTWTYSGEGVWGKEYTVQICWKANCQNYFKIQTNNLKSETKLTGYVAKNRQVIDHQETKYRTEYKDVTKKRFEWIIG